MRYLRQKKILYLNLPCFQQLKATLFSFYFAGFFISMSSIIPIWDSEQKYGSQPYNKKESCASDPETHLNITWPVKWSHICNATLDILLNWHKSTQLSLNSCLQGILWRPSFWNWVIYPGCCVCDCYCSETTNAARLFSFCFTWHFLMFSFSFS